MFPEGKKGYTDQAPTISMKLKKIANKLFEMHFDPPHWLSFTYLKTRRCRIQEQRRSRLALSWPRGSCLPHQGLEGQHNSLTAKRSHCARTGCGLYNKPLHKIDISLRLHKFKMRVIIMRTNCNFSGVDIANDKGVRERFHIPHNSAGVTLKGFIALLILLVIKDQTGLGIVQPSLTINMI